MAAKQNKAKVTENAAVNSQSSVQSNGKGTKEEGGYEVMQEFHAQF